MNVDSPIGRRVEAWIGPRTGQQGTVVRVNGIRMAIVQWDDGAIEEYPNADLGRPTYTP